MNNIMQKHEKRLSENQARRIGQSMVLEIQYLQRINKLLDELNYINSDKYSTRKKYQLVEEPLQLEQAKKSDIFKLDLLLLFMLGLFGLAQTLGRYFFENDIGASLLSAIVTIIIIDRFIWTWNRF